MAATVAGALKAYIEALGLGVSVYRDAAPPKAVRPYITVLEAIATVPDRATTQLDPSGVEVVHETVQVDLWQTTRDPLGGQPTQENLTLKPALLAALRGASLPAFGTPTTQIYSCLVTNARRMNDPDTRVVRDMFTLVLTRQF